MEIKLDDRLAEIADQAAYDVAKLLRDRGIVVEEPWRARLCDWIADSLTVIAR